MTAESKAQLQKSLAEEDPNPIVELLAVLKFLGTITILYALNTIVSVALNMMVLEDHPLRKVIDIWAVLLSLMYTVNAIRTFHASVSSQPNVRTLSAFLDIHELRQQRLRGVEVLQRFRTNHMVICAVWGSYYFLRGNLGVRIYTCSCSDKVVVLYPKDCGLFAERGCKESKNGIDHPVRINVKLSKILLFYTRQSNFPLHFIVHLFSGTNTQTRA